MTTMDSNSKLEAKVLQGAAKLWEKTVDDVFLEIDSEANVASVYAFVRKDDPYLGTYGREVTIDSPTEVDESSPKYTQELLLALLDVIEGALRRKGKWVPARLETN
jgi:hypothetical protein